MNFTDAITSFFKRYADFQGRSSRSEYWFPVLFMWIFYFGLVIAEEVLGWFPNSGGHAYLDLFTIGTLPPSDIFTIVTLLPSSAVGARRLHDIGMSGWWQLLNFTVIGILPLIYWVCKKGGEAENRFGLNPLIDSTSTTALQGQ